jgi:hypothetical protein
MLLEWGTHSDADVLYELNSTEPIQEIFFFITNHLHGLTN